jgi:hypothetical protein
MSGDWPGLDANVRATAEVVDGFRALTRRGTVSLVGMIVLVGLAGTASARTSAPTPGPTPFAAHDACADANGDRLLTVTDGVVALQAAAGLPSSCSMFSCDVDGSGAITVTDGVGILQRAAGLRFLRFYDCPVPTSTRDLSDFTVFHLTRQNGLGFCPEPGSVLSVGIDRRSSGAYGLELTVAAARAAGDPECLGPYNFDASTCIAPDPRPDRLLTPDEVERVRAAFSAIQIFEARAPICEVLVSDPCVVDYLEWDAFRVDDYDHTAPRIDRATTVATLIDVLNTLIVPPAAGE